MSPTRPTAVLDHIEAGADVIVAMANGEPTDFSTDAGVDGDQAPASLKGIVSA